MCVIMVASKVRPSDEMIKRAWEHNRDGFGAAWRDGGDVVWKKGIHNFDDANKLLQEIPLPFVAHFRIKTVGEAKPELTHPYVIDKDASLELEGRTTGNVLFHNGHWTDWNEKALDAAIQSNNKVPVGDWSDTRAMAWMIHLYGPGVMELLTQQKAVIWGPTSYRVFTGKDGWEEINQVWCSNDSFWRKGQSYTVRRNICISAGCKEPTFGNDMYCWECKKARTESHHEETTDKEDHSAIPTVGTEKSSSSSAPVAALTGRVTPLVQFFTLEDVEDLYIRGGVSKSKYKDFKKAYKKLGHGGKQEEKAVEKLTRISDAVAKDLLRGSVV